MCDQTKDVDCIFFICYNMVMERQTQKCLKRFLNGIFKNRSSLFKPVFRDTIKEDKIMYEDRVNEIISEITAFSKETYTKSEYLPELLKLQKELVDLTFNAEHADNSELRLWDVEKHLGKLNDERGNAADAELAKFVQGSRTVCNRIKAERSGNSGEEKVFRMLDDLRRQHGVLHNVELEFDGKRTEIDAIVFTNRAVFIIEIKSSQKDIFIDERGEFYRTGHSMHHDGNIANKMRQRENMLRKALERAGFENALIFNVLTFTNPNIDVENKYRYIKVCGSNYLNTFIEKFSGDQWYTYENLCIMTEAVSEVRCRDEYRMTVDMNEFKRNYAILMAKLEAAERSDSKPVSPKENKMITEKDHEKNKKWMIGIAAVGVTLLSAAGIVCRRFLKNRR